MSTDVNWFVTRWYTRCYSFTIQIQMQYGKVNVRNNLTTCTYTYIDT